MAAILTIGGIAYTMIEDQFDLTNNLDERQRFRCDVIDYAGTAHWQKGEQVVVTDPSLGVIFSGYLYTDKEVPCYPAGAIQHTIDCVDQHWLADKRTYTATYTQSTPAGQIALDQVNAVLVEEGISVTYALHTDNSQTNFGQGILNGTIATSNLGGDLELSTAGSTVTITETATPDFAAGTLTNTQAVSNTLTPTTVNALKVQSTLTAPLSANSIYIKVWQGNQVVGSADVLHYDLWIDSSSKQIEISIDLTFNDGTLLRNVSGIVDQNGLSAAPSTDLTGYANDQWYSRSIALTGLNGKTVNAVTIGIEGNTTGSYTGYVKNCYLQSHSGTPFFNTSITAPPVNPPLIVSYGGYSPLLTAITVASVWIPATNSRISPAYSISAVKVLASSVLTVIGVFPAGTSVVIYASYDGGVTYFTCTNNAPLPNFPVGSNTTGITLTLKEVFFTNTDPTLLPALTNVSITLRSAPNPTATKSDIVTTYATNAEWSAGTLANLTVTSDGTGITLTTPLTRNWDDGLISGQTFFPTLSSTSESASGNAYAVTMPGSNAGVTPQAVSRLDFVGSLLNFTIEFDIKMSSIVSGNQLGLVFRQTNWDTLNNTFAYYVGLDCGSGVIFGYGSNSSSGSYTNLATYSFSPSANTYYHMKVVVRGNNYQVFFNGSGSANINVTDNTYLATGGIGFRSFGGTINGVTNVCTWDNLSVDTLPATNGTWQSPSVSISALGTIGQTVIGWTEQNTVVEASSSPATALIQTSLDGGVTYQTCTNGASIPNLANGANVSGKSIIMLISLTTTPSGPLPIISGLVWRVLGAYSGSSGTRSTAPLGNDTMLRGNSSGSWGTSFDGQGYTKTGTGTIALSGDEAAVSNTTGDVHMQLGSATWTDEDAAVRFSLSTSTISAGIELRYVDANNQYRLSVSTAFISIIKVVSGAATVLVTVANTLSTATWYHMRFRVVGANPATLTGRVWPDGTLEPTTWQATASG